MVSRYNSLACLLPPFLAPPSLLNFGWREVHRIVVFSAEKRSGLNSWTVGMSPVHLVRFVFALSLFLAGCPSIPSMAYPGSAPEATWWAFQTVVFGGSLLCVRMTTNWDAGGSKQTKQRHVVFYTI